jgi:UDP-N-acetylmuramyl pentapeptide phosphotransferase/UDP-N-acetylglucosamine-1-phosphate transferase
MQTYLALFFVSFILCFVIILASGYAFSRRTANDELAIQSAHTGFVPRVGGLAIYISILGLIPLFSFGFIPLSFVFEINTHETTWLVLSAMPVFVVGLAEDLGYSMSPRERIFASTTSSILALIGLKVWVLELGIFGIDALLMFSPFAICFTVFSTVGVVNAFNLIDGLNGLSSYVAISIAAALSVIAFQVSSIQISIFLVLIISSVLGFLILNFPFGKIFLGDGGAYVLGHLLVWSAILLINETSLVSPFAILLIFFWPVADTVLAIWRRWKLGNPTDLPDRLHFHQLTMRFLEIRFFGRYRRNIVNPMSTVLLIPLISTPQILAILFWDNFLATVWCTFIVGLFFVITYLTGISLAKRSRI